MKVVVDEQAGRVYISAFDAERKCATGSGKSPKEAAQWLIRHVNRIADQTERLLIEMGLLTEEEADEAVAAKTDRETP